LAKQLEKQEWIPYCNSLCTKCSMAFSTNGKWKYTRW